MSFVWFPLSLAINLDTSFFRFTNYVLRSMSKKTSSSQDWTRIRIWRLRWRWSESERRQKSSDIGWAHKRRKLINDVNFRTCGSNKCIRSYQTSVLCSFSCSWRKMMTSLVQLSLDTPATKTTNNNNGSNKRRNQNRGRCCDDVDNKRPQHRPLPRLRPRPLMQEEQPRAVRSWPHGTGDAAEAVKRIRRHAAAAAAATPMPSAAQSQSNPLTSLTHVSSSSSSSSSSKHKGESVPEQL